MKTITEYIVEKLKVSSDSTSLEDNFKGYDNKILDVEINSIEELSEVLGKFFDIKPTNIIKSESRWKLDSSSRDGLIVKDKFYIDFMAKDGKTYYSRLRTAKYGDKFIMQLLSRNYKGKMEECALAGYSKSTEFKIGDNLYQWLLKIKSLTENKSVGRNINLMVRFGLME